MDATSAMMRPPVQPPPRSEYAGYHSSSCSRSVTREYQPLLPPQLASPQPQQQPFQPKVRPVGVLVPYYRCYRRRCSRRRHAR